MGVPTVGRRKRTRRLHSGPRATTKVRLLAFSRASTARSADRSLARLGALASPPHEERSTIGAGKAEVLTGICFHALLMPVPAYRCQPRSWSACMLAGDHL